MSTNDSKDWYKDSVIYQIYPQSFYDTNSDGIGDLNGITEKADYIKSLGIKAVWISPFFKSPKVDCGYDISDYYDIDEDYGTLDDLSRLIKAYHERGIKVIADLVINHTSDQHCWFLESRKSKDNPYRDYYIWRDKDYIMKRQKELGEFNQPQWEYDETTDEYYYHSFSKEQPELNWQNEKMRSEIEQVIRYWIEFGIDGFRCDVIYMIGKDTENPSRLDSALLHKYLRELYTNAFSLNQSVTIAELWGYTPEKTLELIEPKREELTLAFQFDHLSRGRKDGKKYEQGNFVPNDFINDLANWQTAINGKAWNTLVLENHDQPRSLSRFGSTRYPDESAKLLAALCFLMQGTAFIYQGEELGLRNPIIEDLENMQDIESVGYYQRFKDDLSHSEILKRVRFGSRDNSRVGMPWNNEIYFGFSDVKPWNDLKCDYSKTNVTSEDADENSVLNFYRALINLKTNDIRFSRGDFKLLHNANNLFCYSRTANEKSAYVLGNFSEETVSIKKYDLGIDESVNSVLLSNYHCSKINSEIKLKPYEIFVAE